MALLDIMNGCDSYSQNPLYPMALFPAVEQLVEQLLKQIYELPAERLILIESLAQKLEGEEKFAVICTHNSRRSQMGQLWIEVAASYFDLPWQGFSAGTEATAVHPQVLAAFKRAGFDYEETKPGENPRYTVRWSEKAGADFYSKTLEDEQLPDAFNALMVCDRAIANCPYVPQAQRRLELPVPDPGVFDEEPSHAQHYDDTLRQMGCMILYLGKVAAQ